MAELCTAGICWYLLIDGDNCRQIYIFIIYNDNITSLQEITDSKTGDEGSQAVALNNKIAERLMTTHPEKLRSVASECIKEIDGLFEKVIDLFQLLHRQMALFSYL